MAEGCGAKCAKMMLIVFNIIFWLSGVAMLAIGIWLLVDKNILELLEFVSLDEGDARLKYVAYLLIAVGCVVAIVGLIGCFGAISESKVLLGIYIFFLCLVMAAEIAAGVLAIVYKDKINDKIEEQIKKELLEDDYITVANGTITYTTFGFGFNLAQYEFKCCGVNEPADYKKSKFAKTQTDYPMPFTCCKLGAKPDDARKVQLADVNDWTKCKTEYSTGAASPTELYSDGCIEAIKDWAKEKTAILIGVGIGIACLELFGFIFALCLCRNRSE